MVARATLARAKIADFRGEDRGGRRRSRPFHGAARRRRRRGGRVQRIHAAAAEQGHESAGRGARNALPKFLRFCVLMTGKTLTERREDAIRFMTAQIKAFRYAVTHRDETIKLALEATAAKADDPRPAFIYEEGREPRRRRAGFPDPGGEPGLDPGPDDRARPAREGRATSASSSIPISARKRWRASANKCDAAKGGWVRSACTSIEAVHAAHRRRGAQRAGAQPRQLQGE